MSTVHASTATANTTASKGPSYATAYARKTPRTAVRAATSVLNGLHIASAEVARVLPGKRSAATVASISTSTEPTVVPAACTAQRVTSAPGASARSALGAGVGIRA